MRSRREWHRCTGPHEFLTGVTACRPFELQSCPSPPCSVHMSTSSSSRSSNYTARLKEAILQSQGTGCALCLRPYFNSLLQAEHVIDAANESVTGGKLEESGKETGLLNKDFSRDSVQNIVYRTSISRYRDVFSSYKPQFASLVMLTLPRDWSHFACLSH